MLEPLPEDLGGLDRQMLADFVAVIFDARRPVRLCRRLPERGHGGRADQCIRTNLDCADIRATTAGSCSATPGRRQPHPGRPRGLPDRLQRPAVLSASSTTGMHEYCHVCAEVMPRCEKACEELLSSLG